MIIVRKIPGYKPDIVMWPTKGWSFLIPLLITNIRLGGDWSAINSFLSLCNISIYTLFTFKINPCEIISLLVDQEGRGGAPYTNKTSHDCVNHGLMLLITLKGYNSITILYTYCDTFSSIVTASCHHESKLLTCIV